MSAPGEELDPEPLLALGVGFWPAKVLMTAVELGVFGALAARPQNADELLATLGLHPRGARDFFDALVALQLLERSEDVYENTPLSDHFLDPKKPSYIGGLLEMTNSRLYPVWSQLGHALKSGAPRNEASEQDDYYGELGRDRDRLAVFLRGMTGLSAAASRHIARRPLWADYRTFVDVGGAEGGLAVQVALANPHLTGAGFDLPPVRPYFDAYVQRFGLGDRLHFCGGDFWQDALPEADVIVLGHVLHNWNLAQKRVLLEKAYAALPRGGALIVHESLIDDGRRQNLGGLLMSLNMLLVTREGFGFTGRQCQAWMAEAGFARTEVEHLAGAEWMIVAIK